MYVKTLTIGTTVTRLVPQAVPVDPPAPFQTVIFANNNTTDAVYIGDSAVSSSNGIKIAAGNTLSVTLGVDWGADLKDFWAVGAGAGDAITYMLLP